MPAVGRTEILRWRYFDCTWFGNQINVIDHKFFISGHSYMDADRDFAIIEKAKRKFPSDFVPEYWSEVISKVGKYYYVVNQSVRV